MKIVHSGYSLKKHLLEKWIHNNHFSQRYVALKLELEPEEFKHKLRERQKFNHGQIKSLVYLMGAEEAFNVLYFPSKRQRRRVWRQVFVKYRRKERMK